eukprot:7433198-Lingulodinium_polyedra.AAC.1
MALTARASSSATAATQCLPQPLATEPPGDWYCPTRVDTHTGRRVGGGQSKRTALQLQRRWTPEPHPAQRNRWCKQPGRCNVHGALASPPSALRG